MTTPHWWQTSVIYQIYPRSFNDSNHDGVGDLNGIIAKMDYLQDLGIKAIWISPFYPSPMKDFGYDVADYCDVEPIFGDLATFDRLVASAHAHGIKVIIDWVPNHTSDQHPWFLESRSSKDNPKRNWYIWKDAKPDGTPPNNWGSVFGGSGWEWDEHTQQYYFHQFVPEQPDLNWRNPEVKEAMFETLRFWLRRGIDGFRMDVVGMIIKHPDMPDQPLAEGGDPHDLLNAHHHQQHIYDQDYEGIHDMMREIRLVVQAFGEDKVTIGEIWNPLPSWQKYYGTPEVPGLHMPFNFRLLEGTPWTADNVRQEVRQTEQAVPPHGFPNYVLNNHDRPRFASRVSVAQARNAAIFLMTVRGTPTIYNGEELGMVDGVILPHQVRDPQGIVRGIELTRDVCRTPMPWDNSAYAGFSSVEPWLPVNADYLTVNVASESQDKHSILNLYKSLMALRNASNALTIGSYQELSAPSGVFAYERRHSDERYIIALNFTNKPITFKIPAHGHIVVDSGLKRKSEPVPHDLELWGDEGVVIRVQA
jgi:alpha-glucosidase